MADSLPGEGQQRPRLEIPIPTFQPYVPGSVPIQQISLLPAGGRSAYIVDRIVYPLYPATFIDKHTRPGDRVKRICYIVSWKSHPAARCLIDCSKALEYLSPRVIEDWEYNDCLRRETEAREKAARDLAAKNAPAAPAKKAESKRKRGRPPRAALNDQHPPTPVIKEEERKPGRPKRAAGPSLSTPRKRRFKALPDEEEAYDDSGDKDYAEDDATEEEAQVLAADSDMDLETPPPRRSAANGSGTPRQPGPAGAGRPRPTPAPSLPGRPPSLMAELNGRASSATSTGVSSASLAPHSTTPTPGTVPAKTKSKAVSRAADAERQQQSTRSSAPASIGIPVDVQVPVAPRSASSRPPESFREADATPLPSALAAPRGAVSSETPSVATTPAHGSLRPKRTHAAATAPAPTLTETPATATAPSKKRRKPRQKKAKTKYADAQWEVERLEGDKVERATDGTVTRYFLVKWVGDWPLEQNPSWEPEENVSPALVTGYLKKKVQRPEGEMSPANPKLHQSTLSPWREPKYTSVTEAFEGHMEDMTLPVDGADDVEDDGAGEQFRVTTEDKKTVSPSPSAGPSRSSIIDLDLARQVSLFSQTV